MEETVNQDTQTPGGTKGFSLNPSALSKYYLSAEYRNISMRQLRQLTRLEHSKLQHPDLEPSRISKDEEAVTNCLSLLQDSWINPFQESSDTLVSLSSGVAVPQDIITDITDAYSKGEAAYLAFNERLSKGEGFYNRIPLMKLKTMSSMKKQIRVAMQNRECVLVAEHNLFSRMLFFASLRGLDMENVLSWPLGPIPWALANYDGTPKKTNKSTLGKYLEQQQLHADPLPSSVASIIDGMSFVQKLEAENLTFSDVSRNLLRKCLNCVSQAAECHIVFDDYRHASIKNIEREMRGSEKAITYSTIVPGHTIRGWKKLLGSSVTKQKLVKYLTEDWSNNPDRLREIGNRVVYATNGSHCYHISTTGKHWKIHYIK